MGAFHGLSKKKIRSKVSQKPAIFPDFYNFSLFPLPLSPPWRSATTIPTTIVSSPSLLPAVA
jgi:hypothetical protein